MVEKGFAEWLANGRLHRKLGKTQGGCRKVEKADGAVVGGVLLAVEVALEAFGGAVFHLLVVVEKKVKFLQGDHLKNEDRQ